MEYDIDHVCKQIIFLRSHVVQVSSFDAVTQSCINYGTWIKEFYSSSMGYFICVKMRVNRYKHYDSWFFLCTYWTQSAYSEQLSLSRAGIVRNMHSTRLKPVHRVSRMESAASLLYFFAIALTDRSPCTNTENNSCIRSVGVTSTSFALVW